MTIAEVFALLTVCLSPQGNVSEFSRLQGPYLGQEPPGMSPEIFAPGVISTQDHDGLYGFLRDGTVAVFDRASAGTSNPKFRTYLTTLGETGWTEPREINLLDGPSDATTPLVPSEDTLVVGSRRATDGIGMSDWGHNLWVVRYSDTGFVGPRIFEGPVNSEQNEIHPSVTADGTIYFFSNRGGDFTNEDIFRSRRADGRYPEVERLGSPVNTEHDEIDPFIAADESYLIFCSATRDGLGDYDLFVSFRKPDGSWEEPVNMGEGINSEGKDWIPYVTPDGKYFFFNSDRFGSADVFWVDARIIQSLRAEPDTQAPEEISEAFEPPREWR